MGWIHFDGMPLSLVPFLPLCYRMRKRRCGSFRRNDGEWVCDPLFVFCQNPSGAEVWRVALRKKRKPLPVEILRAAVESLGYECVGVERVAEGTQPVLRIYIDSLGGINVKDCETVSRKVSVLLDEQEALFEERYFLEVSSPGLERPLFAPTDYGRFCGEKICIQFHGAAGRMEKRAGMLCQVTDESVTLRVEDGAEIVVSWGNIARAHLVYEPEKPAKPGRGGAAHAPRS